MGCGSLYYTYAWNCESLSVVFLQLKYPFGRFIKTKEILPGSEFAIDLKAGKSDLKQFPCSSSP